MRRIGASSSTTRTEAVTALEGSPRARSHLRTAEPISDTPGISSPLGRRVRADGRRRAVAQRLAQPARAATRAASRAARRAPQSASTTRRTRRRGTASAARRPSTSARPASTSSASSLAGVVERERARDAGRRHRRRRAARSPRRRRRRATGCARAAPRRRARRARRAAGRAGSRARRAPDRATSISPSRQSDDVVGAVGLVDPLEVEHARARRCRARAPRRARRRDRGHLGGDVREHDLAARRRPAPRPRARRRPARTPARARARPAAARVSSSMRSVTPAPRASTYVGVLAHAAGDARPHAVQLGAELVRRPTGLRRRCLLRSISASSYIDYTL